jgi:hypothetical protein
MHFINFGKLFSNLIVKLMKRIKKNHKAIILWVFTLLLPFSVISGEAKNLFPEVEGWKVNVGDQVYTPENLWDLINGAADAYLSYDFKDLHTAEYSNDKGQTVKVYAFRHSTPTNTFGIYTQERNPDYEFLDIGAQGFKSPGALYFIKGSYYIQISTNDKPLYDKLEPLARKIDESLDIEADLPAELNLLPPEGKIGYSEKYIANDFLGYSYLHSAFVADYEQNGKEFQVFIMAPENKEEVQSMLNQFLDTQDYPKDQRNKKVYRIDAKYIGSVLLYPSGKYLFGIKKADKKMEEKYLKMFKAKMD